MSLTTQEREVVTLIRAGFTRQAIARILDVSVDTVRDTVIGLCERYDCRMEKLPEAVNACERK